MNSRNALNIFAAVTTLAVVATLAGTALAQPAPAPTSRAAVKAETRAAEQAHELTPAGEGAEVGKPSTARSTKTRADRKAETLAASKAHQLASAGEGESFSKPTKLSSTKTRAERKSETLTAVKAGQLTPAGEGPDAPAK